MGSVCGCTVDAFLGCRPCPNRAAQTWRLSFVGLDYVATGGTEIFVSLQKQRDKEMNFE